MLWGAMSAAVNAWVSSAFDNSEVIETPKGMSWKQQKEQDGYGKTSRWKACGVIRLGSPSQGRGERKR